MQQEFEDKIAIVTGGAKGIGAATVRALVAGGARVTVFDVDRQAGEAFAAALDGCTFSAVDITNGDAVGAAVDALIAREGQVDLLVNNAAIAPPLTVARMTAEDWERVLRVNLTGAYHCIDAVVRQMKSRRSGSIVNVSSVAGKNISLGAGVHYTTSKWGIIGLSRHLGYELAPFGIRVNIVCPGPTLTTLLQLDDEARERAASSVPLGRWVEPEDVANAILFFLGPRSSMCTGAEIVVDGGVLLGSGDAYDSYFAQRGDSVPEREIRSPGKRPRTSD